MLYKHLFSILCGHLNLNQIFLNLAGYQSNRPVNRLPVGTVYTCDFEFKFKFDRFSPVFGQTGPVNRYRRAAV